MINFTFFIKQYIFHFAALGKEINFGPMAIKSSVYFYVQRNTSYDKKNSVIQRGVEGLNVRGAMDITTGVFTVFCDGIYKFYFNGIKVGT